MEPFLTDLEKLNRFKTLPYNLSLNYLAQRANQLKPSSPIHHSRVINQLFQHDSMEDFFGEETPQAHRLNASENPYHRRPRYPGNTPLQGNAPGRGNFPPNRARPQQPYNTRGDDPFSRRVEVRCDACAYFGHQPTSCRYLARFASIMRYYNAHQEPSNELATRLHSHLNDRNRRTVARTLIQANPDTYGHMNIEELAETSCVEDILMEDFL